MCYIMQMLTSVCAYGYRIQLTVSLSRGTNTACREQNIFPLYVLLATPTSNLSLEEVSLPFLSFNRYFVPNYLLLLTKCYAQHPPIYRFSRAYFLTSFGGFGSKDHTKATFVIPDIENLASSRASNLNIIIISRGMMCIICYSVCSTVLHSHHVLIPFSFSRTSWRRYW